MEPGLGSRVRVRLQRRDTNSIDGSNHNNSSGVGPGSLVILAFGERCAHERNHLLRERKDALEIQRQDFGERLVGVYIQSISYACPRRA